MKLREFRWPACFGLAATLFLLMMCTVGRETTLGHWGIRTISPSFPDTRGITAGLESFAEGKDPLVENPQDPWKRPLNYPRVWLQLSHFGINQSHTDFLGHALTAFFLLGVLVFPPKDLCATNVGLMLVATFSPAVLLGVERGNIDLLMFFLLAVGIVGFTGGKAWAKGLGSACLIAGFVLKIYPLLGAAMILGERRRNFLVFAISLTGVSAIYLCWIRADLVLILKATPRATGLSYGMDVLWMELVQHGEQLGTLARYLSLAGVGAAGIILTISCFQSRPKVTAEPAHLRAFAAFRAGAAVYCGTFVLGNNWDYRLVFLLFTVPFLGQSLGSIDLWIKRVSFVSLAAILISLWHVTIYNNAKSLPHGSETSVLLDELSNWTVFFGLSYLLGRFTPVWRESRHLSIPGTAEPAK